jgi:hypothetical protein
MRLWPVRKVSISALASVLLWTPTLLTAQNDSTFVIKVSLPTPKIHVGDDLVIEEIVSNPTDHVVFVGNGPGVGTAVELLNEKGEDLGRYAMGETSKENHEEPTVVIHGNKLSLRPGSTNRAVVHYKPTAGYLIPGTYKLRTHIHDMRDVTSGAQVYSNTVILTILP